MGVFTLYLFLSSDLHIVPGMYGFKVTKFELTEDNVRKCLSLWQASFPPSEEGGLVCSTAGFHYDFDSPCHERVA